MKNKFQLLFILFTIIIIFSFPSICFSELKTVQGEYCHIFLGDKKDIEREREITRLLVIKNGIQKLTKNKKVDNIEVIDEIKRNYLENVKIISHKEKGRRICEKIQITVDIVVLNEFLKNVEITEDGHIIVYLGPLLPKDRKEVITTCDFIKDSINTEQGQKNIGIIIEVRNNEINEDDKEKLGDIDEQYFHNCLSSYLKNNIKIIDRRHIKKILEEQKLSSSGITDKDTIKVGKLSNLDIIILKIRYSDVITTKVLKVDTGEVLLLLTHGNY